MKRLLLILCSFCLYFSSAIAQTYRNEWIDFNNTYYKFSIGQSGLYRIYKSDLDQIGLGQTAIEQFSIWQNGRELPLYTTVPVGPLPNDGYIEFFASRNDGKADKALYKSDSLQMNDHRSLYTDSSTCFLTTSTSTHKRYVNLSNPVSVNVLPAETGFLYTQDVFFEERLNPGYAVDYGSLLYSASYETGEGWSSFPFGPGPFNYNHQLPIAPLAATASIDAVIAGNATAIRPVQLRLNGSLLAEKSINNYGIGRFHVSAIPLNQFPGNQATIQIVHGGIGTDQIVVSSLHISYPRTFNFENSTQFAFELPPGPERYLEINNFNFNAENPVLLDTLNNTRIIGDVQGQTIRFVLPATSNRLAMILLSRSASQIIPVHSFTQRNFTNYKLAINQGNYIIISHKNLHNDGTGYDPVAAYEQYRSSTVGGSYKVLVNDIDELTDQFAYGIQHHPAAIRNFGYFARNYFQQTIQHVLLIGKGLTYPEYRLHESNDVLRKLALVPTFGSPASDNLLFADRTGTVSAISVGRISAITGLEVKAYLEKIIQYEAVQDASQQDPTIRSRMKNVAQITGAINDPVLSTLINFYMDGYKSTISDTSFGGHVYSFSSNSGNYTAAGTNKTIDNLFSEGLSYLSYFGHSSPNTLEFNLDNPANYQNTGKYPLILVNGCNTGNLFMYDSLRTLNKSTLSEQYVLAPQKGSIGFIANTHFGLPLQLDYFTSRFNQNLAALNYGQPIGHIMQQTMAFLNSTYGSDYATRIHAEEITYHGDPAIRLNSFPKPDFSLIDSFVSIVPDNITAANNAIELKIHVINIGRAINDSLEIVIKHQLPNGSITLLDRRRIRAPFYLDSIRMSISINPLDHIGFNQIIIELDPAEEINELSESNNRLTREFYVSDAAIHPIFPYSYAVVNNITGNALFASTAKTVDAERTYVLQLDTSKLFQSPLFYTETVSDSGGVIRFQPQVNWRDSTVYYWRVAMAPITENTRWEERSFTRIHTYSGDGYGQAHHGQFAENSFENMYLDSVDKSIKFKDLNRKLLIRTGLFPYYLFDQINVNVENDQLDLYGCKYNSLQFVVYHPLTLKPWRNVNVSASHGRFGSERVCFNSASSDTGRIFFEFYHPDPLARAKALEFLDSIPDGYWVSITNLGKTDNTTFVNQWKADTMQLGSGNSLWHEFHRLGLTKIDSFYRNIPFVFLFKKGDTASFSSKQIMGATQDVHLVESFAVAGKTVSGSFQTAQLGPVKSWKQFQWNTKNEPTSTDVRRIDISGIDVLGDTYPQGSVYVQNDTSISFIKASNYPYLQLRMQHDDIAQANPDRLKFWFLSADIYPELALAPNKGFICSDTLTSLDTLDLFIVCENVSSVNFDSISLKLTLELASGIKIQFDRLQNDRKIKPLDSGDTAWISFRIPMTGINGAIRLKLELNPDRDQYEQYAFNNLLVRSIYVQEPVCNSSQSVFRVQDLPFSKQWEMDRGTGFVDIQNGLEFSGVQDTVLQVTASTNLMDAKFRCRYYNSDQFFYSSAFILQHSTIWTGASNDAWENPLNWSCGSVPDRKTKVLIPGAVVNNPVINNSTECRSLTIQPGGNLLISAGVNLLLSNQ